MQDHEVSRPGTQESRPGTKGMTDSRLGIQESRPGTMGMMDSRPGTQGNEGNDGFKTGNTPGTKGMTDSRLTMQIAVKPVGQTVG